MISWRVTLSSSALRTRETSQRAALLSSLVGPWLKGPWSFFRRGLHPNQPSSHSFWDITHPVKSKPRRRLQKSLAFSVPWSVNFRMVLVPGRTFASSFTVPHEHIWQRLKRWCLQISEQFFYFVFMFWIMTSIRMLQCQPCNS